MMNTQLISYDKGKTVKLSDGLGDYSVVVSGSHCYIVESLSPEKRVSSKTNYNNKPEVVVQKKDNPWLKFTPKKCSMTPSEWKNQIFRKI